MLPVFFLALLSWLFQLRLFKGYGAVENRRQVTGGEVARAILDAAGFSSVMIQEASEPLSGLEKLSLPPAVYSGRSLRSCTRAARAALVFSHKQPFLVTGDFPESVSRWLYLAGLWSWAPVFFAWEPAGLMGEIAFWVWTGFFLLGFFSIPAEKTLEQQILSGLRETGFFEVDEMVRIKKCFMAYRIGAFSIPFRAAAYFLSGCSGAVEERKGGR